MIYAVVRRWRGPRATITVHESDCPSVNRREVAFFVEAVSPVAAEALAHNNVREEIMIGTTRWGLTCTRCCDETPLTVSSNQRKVTA